MRQKYSHIIKQIRYEWINLTEIIANIGGAFGVFIGFSMISIFEVIYFCCFELKPKRINEFRLIRLKQFSQIKINRKILHQIILNEIEKIQKQTEIFILKYILKIPFQCFHRLMWIFITIILFLLSILFIQIIWIRSYSNPLIVSIGSTNVPTSMVKQQIMVTVIT